ncbi:hypothetical protein [Streptomyces flavofungini]|uniref:hypothetical protein n=1 Tax=Streptomyces flavofungini TaxID=68200 RepID=UPI0025B1BB50|nr:hypothetical protein [Streptomyces flavofungini]WJV48845.1 hypothetical protein QUY26_27045 [Streptomyces flavofungini]
MNPRFRIPPGVPLAALAVAVLSACGATSGLGDSEPAPRVSVQPRPEPLWSAWSGSPPSAPGADPTSQQPPPEPLDGLDPLGPGGLAKADVRELLRADTRLRTLADRPLVKKPGRPGIRPPVLTDLTGDGKPEMLVAVDVESGRSVLVVYYEKRGKVHPILFTAGRRLAVETLGTDLLVRSPCAEGGEQAVRFHWDGTRMSTVSDVKSYGKGGKGDTDGGPGGSGHPDSTGSPGTRP